MTTESTTLLERSNAGVHVEINWLPVTRTVVLRVEVGGESAFTEVPAGRTLDAFEHPTVYLNDAQVAQLFPKTTSER